MEKIIMRWYRHEALQLFTECVGHFAPLMNVSPNEIKLSAARTQWGKLHHARHGAAELATHQDAIASGRLCRGARTRPFARDEPFDGVLERGGNNVPGLCEAARGVAEMGNVVGGIKQRTKEKTLNQKPGFVGRESIATDGTTSYLTDLAREKRIS